MISVYLKYRPVVFLLYLLCTLFNGCKPDKDSESRWVQKFNGHYGQIEVGGKYAGLEFHHSRPLPSRISFYYPVANSIDLSYDYWQRDQSRPYTMLVQHKDKTDSIALVSCDYVYTPCRVEFELIDTDYRLQIDYDFCDDLPAVVVQSKLKNMNDQTTEFSIFTDLTIILRTCQTYITRLPAAIEFGANHQYALARFNSSDTDSSLLFIINPSGSNDADTGLEKIFTTDSIPVIRFYYKQKLAPNQELNTVQLIGTSTRAEWDSLMPLINQKYRASIKKYHTGIQEYIQGPSKLSLLDTTLLESYYWSKAVLATNRHYLDGTVVPMPCPAEYNFFFTHDVLLTDLAAVYFDVDRVHRDLLYLLSLTRPDSILPHAYYFKDGIYQTEFCNSDNWNHLWFLILAGSYYHHSSDHTTIKQIYPLLKKSIHMMLGNKGTDQLMYAFRPDWWDIGHVYGARSYLTILMIQALRFYVQIGLSLEQDHKQLLNYLQLADQMTDSLSTHLWDERRGYLFNMLDTQSTDTHYYAGSLLGAAFNILDDQKSARLLQTAAQQLLDPNIGIRIAMPADFHRMIDVYRFNGLEMGKPYLYLNGGCWPHGTAWYILGQIRTGQIEEAQKALKKYLTLDGIAHSPQGQPSFYEYRNTNSKSEQYGQIDKPTFLWAAGWYLYTLYNLLGVREDPGNVYFQSLLPEELGEKIEYDLMVFGSLAHVHWQGNGKYFERIIFDDQQVPSSVVYKPVHHIKLVRGKPLQPYLSTSNVMIKTISFDQDSRVMAITLNGIEGQKVKLEIVSPLNLDSVILNQIRLKNGITAQNDNGIRTYKIVFTLSDRQVALNCLFL
jgi:hypothetical protein